MNNMDWADKMMEYLRKVDENARNAQLKSAESRIMIDCIKHRLDALEAAKGGKGDVVKDCSSCKHEYNTIDQDPCGSCGDYDEWQSRSSAPCPDLPIVTNIEEMVHNEGFFVRTEGKWLVRVWNDGNKTFYVPGRGFLDYEEIRGPIPTPKR